MDPRPLAFFADATKGQLVGVSPDTQIARVCTDSREVRPGDLFVAVRGDRCDGHDFVHEALARGALAAVVASECAARFGQSPRLVVANPRQALGQMAARYREDFTQPVVAVAGSNGKTTTKDLIASILGGCFETLSSPESYNNDIGVPLTLLSFEDRHLAAVLEIGTNHPGELAPLVRMAQPQVGVMTHLGEEHLEFLGSLAGVIEEEGWLAELLPQDGILILPGDPDWARMVEARTQARIVRVGEHPDNDWQLTGWTMDQQGCTFQLRAPREELSGEYRVNLIGRHQVGNGMLAAAAAAEFGLGREEIARGMARCQPARWRMSRWQWEGVDVIEDCYNANLDSTLAALEALRDLPCAGRRVVVLGGMAELGSHTGAAHRTIGKRIATLGIDRLLTVGDAAAVSAEAASDAGMEQAMAVDALSTAAANLRAFLRPGDCVLIKGSRSARLERLGMLLRQESSLQHAA